ncbi:MAG: hypothetical protein Q8909_13240 [Bacteroidota bacterium]|nr:hypothetical protein [Bacteroidota bacterium]
MKVQFNILLIIIVLFGSCASKQTKAREEQSMPSAGNISLFDSNDADSYVGFVYRYYFQKTDEFYVELYFKQGEVDEDEYSKIAGSVDSTIFKDEENRRSRVPLKVAYQQFDFRGMETLSLFDKNNTFLTQAHFVRVEYLDQNISPVFTAVYKADNPRLTEKALYCVGNLKDKFVTENYISNQDSALTQEIEQKLGYTHRYTLEGKHFLTKDNRSISALNIDSTAVIVEKKHEQLDCLYKSKVSENIFDIVFVPIIRNSRPVILTKKVVPDTDVVWDDLLIFDGKQYQSSVRQRIKN